MVDYSPKDIGQVDCGYWAILNKIKLQSGLFSFLNHEYQVEVMGNDCKRACYMKGTQGGFTETEVLRTLWGMINGRYLSGVLYMFPTSDVVLDFSKSRFNPLIQANKDSIGKYVKSGGRGTDSAGLKKIFDAFLYLRGARLVHKEGEEASASVQTSSIPVDKVVFDEVDQMDEQVIAKAIGRMRHSRVQEEVYIGNPSLPGVGIDKIFNLSDQRHWFRKCGCGAETCAELTFPDCVKIRKDGTGYIGCSKCGKELGIKPGKWVAQRPDNTNYMRGYRWSQLTSVYSDPANILDEFINPPEGNLGDVYRLRLGLPYVSSEDKLTQQEVLLNCGNDISPTRHSGPCAMGVDIGKIKHVVIGVRTGNDAYEIIKVVKVSDWNDIHDLIQKYNVKSAVIDIRPYEDEARKFQKDERIKIFLCEYSENSTQGTIYNDHTGIVKVNRTEIFDNTHRLFTSVGRLRMPRFGTDIKEFTEQCCNAYKVLEKNKRTGQMIYRYRGENEHYRNALNYFILAASGNRVNIVNVYKTKRNEVADNEYARV